MIRRTTASCAAADGDAERDEAAPLQSFGFRIEGIGVVGLGLSYWVGS